MRRVLLSLLALIGVGCALVVTASSTMRQAYGAGMPEPVPLALVGLLEVVNIAGTTMWLTDGRARHQLEAAAGVALASLVTAVCGALTYGPLGLVAPFGLLAAVHLVSRLWAPTTDEATPTETPTGADEHAQGDPKPPTPAPAARDSDEAIVAALLERSTLPGRDAVKSEFSVGTRRAERVLEAAAAHRRPHLVTAEEATS